MSISIYLKGEIMNNKNYINQKIKVSEYVTKKACSCGKDHSFSVVSAKINQDGIWFDCSCGSTLFIPLKKAAYKVG